MSGKQSTPAPETVTVRKNDFALKTRKVSIFLQSSTSSAAHKQSLHHMKVFQDFISKLDSTEKHQSNFGNLCTKKGGLFQKEWFSFLLRSSMGKGLTPETPSHPHPVRTPLIECIFSNLFFVKHQNLYPQNSCMLPITSIKTLQIKCYIFCAFFEAWWAVPCYGISAVLRQKF